MEFRNINGTDLLWMRNEPLVSHIPIATIVTILFLFQIAILEENVSLLQGDNRNVWKTYVRSAISSVAEAIPT
jgi:hypothetical protein